MVILDTKSPFAILLTLTIMIAVAFTYWTFISSAEKFANIKYQKELWKEKEPSSYSYSVYNGCMIVQKSEAIVLFGDRVFRKPDLDGKFLVGEVDIDELFSTIDKAQAQAHSIEVKYNADYGYPESIQVDWSETTLDDECFFVVEDFENLG